MNIITSTKKCSKCHTDKSRADFYIDRAKKDGIQSRCKMCNCAAAAAWRLANADRKATSAKAYRVEHYAAGKAYKHRRRAQKLSAEDGSVDTAYLLCLRKIQDGRCAYCFDALPEVGSHLDHVVPLSRGGLHSARNVVYACQACNLSKGAKLLEDWLELNYALPTTTTTTAT